jgi:cytochrome P450
VLAAFRDPRLSSQRTAAAMSLLPASERGRFASLEQSLGRWMLFLDPPAHSGLRSLINKGFVPRLVESMRPRIEATVAELLDGRRPAAPGTDPESPFDLVRDLARPLPARVIADLIGVPPGARAAFKQAADDLATFMAPGGQTVAHAEAATSSSQQVTAFLDEVIATRRSMPADDFITALLRAEELGVVLSHDELVATCIMLLFGGHETTTNLIGNGLVALARHPAETARLRQDPKLLNPAVEELLRYDGPIQMMSRVAVEPLEIEGTTIAQGGRVLMVLASANRDDRQFRDPDVLDLGRRDNRHLAFGFGIHFCVGAALARLEAQVAFAAVLERWPTLDFGTEIAWSDNLAFRCPRALVPQG